MYSSDPHIIFPGKLSELTLSTMIKVIAVWIEKIVPEVEGRSAMTNYSKTSG